MVCVKHLRQVVLKKKIFLKNISTYFYDSNLGPSGVGLFWTPGPPYEENW